MKFRKNLESLKEAYHWWDRGFILYRKMTKDDTKFVSVLLLNSTGFKPRSICAEIRSRVALDHIRLESPDTKKKHSHHTNVMRERTHDTHLVCEKIVGAK